MMISGILWSFYMLGGSDKAGKQRYHVFEIDSSASYPQSVAVIELL